MTGSISEWGKRHGVSKQAAWKRVQKHAIPVVDGKIDFEEADRIWKASCNVLQMQRGTGKVAAAFQSPASTPESPKVSHLAHKQLEREEVRLQKEKLELERLTIELQKLRAEIIPLEDLKAAFGQLITYTREQLLAIPAQLRDSLGAAKDAGARERMIEDRIIRALINLSNFRLSATA